MARRFPIETQDFRFMAPQANDGQFGSDMPFSYPQLTQSFHLSTISVGRLVKRTIWLPNDNGQVVVVMFWGSSESNVESCGDLSALSCLSNSMTPHANLALPFLANLQHQIPTGSLNYRRTRATSTCPPIRTPRLRRR